VKRQQIIAIIIFFIGSISCNAQLNELTTNEVYQIKINNVTLEGIEIANADLTKMNTLFKVKFDSKNYNLPQLGKEFWNKDFLIRLEDTTNKNTLYSLSYIEIKNTSVNVTVKNVTYKIGDHISKFGSLKINTFNNINSVVFTDKTTGSVALSFRIDQTTNKVNEIVFNAY
jgi:hypothetical protein